VHAPVTKGLSKALVLALLSAAPLILVDNFLTLSFHLEPILRLPALLAVFVVLFLMASKALRVFSGDDFDLLENALPRFLTPLLRTLERILVQIPQPM
jgi:hypothetical protein